MPKRKRSDSNASWCEEDAHPLPINWVPVEYNIFPDLDIFNAGLEKPPRTQVEKENFISVTEKFLGLIDDESPEKQPHPAISKADLAQVVVAWPVRHLPFVRSKRAEQVVAWHALESCLSRLIKEDYGVFLTTLLPSKTMNKLVPMCLDSALGDHHECAEAAQKCYVCFLENLYEPSFEQMCGTVVKQLFTYLEEHTESSPPWMPDLLGSTFKRLQLQQNKVGQKRIFLTICKQETLVMLLRLSLFSEESKVAVETVIEQGLFHAEHMDGFRSLKLPILKNSDQVAKVDANDPKADKSTQMRSYQGVLVDNFEQILTDKNISDSTRHLVLTAAPMLLKGFVKKSSDHHQAKAKKGSQKVESLQSVQFRMFATLVRPMLALLKETATKEFRREMMTGLHTSLSIVLENDLYLPSPIHQEDEAFQFLCNVLDCVLSMRAPEDVDQRAWIADICLGINHKLVLDRLEEVCSTLLVKNVSGGYADTAHTSVAKVFADVVNTYGKLRQLDQLFGAFVQIADLGRSPEFYQRLRELFGAETVMVEFWRAVRVTPSAQIVEILQTWSILIPKAISKTATIEKVNEHCLAFLVEVLTYVVRFVHVEENSAMALSDVATSLLENCVGQLIVQSSGRLLNGKGFVLCGWILDLRMRCAFWTGGNSTARGADFLPDVVRSLLDTFNDFEASDEVPDGLQFLGCYRIQQLHSLIQDRQRYEVSLGLNNTGSQMLVEEATRLSASLGNIAVRSDQRQTQNWLILCETAPSWLPYANEAHKRSLLSWLWKSLSVVSVHDLSRRAAALCMMQDANFHEIGHTQLVDTAFTQVAVLMSDFVVLRYQRRKLKFKHTEMFAEKQPNRPVDRSGKELVDLIEETTLLPDVPSKSLGISIEKLESVRRILSVLESLPDLYYSSSETSSCMTWAIETEHVCRAVVRCSSEERYIACSVVFLSWTVVGRLMNFYPCPGCHKDDLCNALLLNTHKTISLIKYLSPSVPEKLRSSMIRSSGSLIRSLTNCAKDVTVLVKGLGSVELAGEPGMSMNSHVVLNRALAQGLRLRSKGQMGNSYTSQSEIIALLSSMCKYAWEKGLEGKATSLKARDECLMLLADMILLSRALNETSWFTEGRLDSAISLLKKSDLKGSKPFAYFVASVSFLTMSDHHRDVLAELIIDCNDPGNENLVIAFGRLSSVMSENALEKVVTVLGQAVFPPSPWKTILYTKLLSNETIPDEFLSPCAGSFFFDSIGELTAPIRKREAWKYPFDASVALLTSLSKRKEVFVIRERHIASIFAAVDAVLNTCEQKCDWVLDSHIFSSFAALVSLFFQRFSKQICVCVPSSLRTLISLLRHVIYGKVSGDMELTDRAMRFSRLCELILPHKDIFRKHVVGIILEFVLGLKNGMSLERKRAILPSVYIVLDMLTQYETTMLNGLMDANAKALFRPVYQSYQKVHVYKGQ